MTNCNTRQKICKCQYAVIWVQSHLNVTLFPHYWTVLVELEWDQFFSFSIFFQGRWSRVNRWWWLGRKWMARIRCARAQNTAVHPSRDYLHLAPSTTEVETRAKKGPIPKNHLTEEPLASRPTDQSPVYHLSFLLQMLHIFFHGT